MKAQELRELSREELMSKRELLKREIYNLSFKGVIEKIDDNSIFSKNKKDIARINTILHEIEQQKLEEADL